MLRALLTLFAIGLIAVVVLGIVLSILGAVFSLTLGLASFLLFRIAPIVLLGWVVLKILDRGKSRSQLSAADQAWLEGRR